VPPRRAVRRLLRAARPARRRVRLETDQRRAQLLELAKVQFSTRAYDDVSIDDLAREAKISKGLLYHYFPTKRDLYVAGLSEIANELVAAIIAVPQDLPPLDRVRRGLDAYLSHIQRHAKAYVSLMRGGIGSDPEVVDVVEGVRTRLFERFLTGPPFTGLFTGDARFETTIRGWIGFVEAATIDWCANPRLSQSELRDLLAQILPEILRVVAPSVIKP
jgi:AcrR family transcriptional regulator